MPYLILNPDNTIFDIVTDEVGGDVHVTKEDLLPVIKSRYGHIEFRHQAGALVKNPAIAARFDLEKEKAEAVEDFIKKEIELVIRERAGAILTNIEKATTKAELAALMRG